MLLRGPKEGPTWTLRIFEWGGHVHFGAPGASQAQWSAFWGKDHHRTRTNKKFFSKRGFGLNLLCKWQTMHAATTPNVRALRSCKFLWVGPTRPFWCHRGVASPWESFLGQIPPQGEKTGQQCYIDPTLSDVSSTIAEDSKDKVRVPLRGVDMSILVPQGPRKPMAALFGAKAPRGAELVKSFYKERFRMQILLQMEEDACCYDT